MNKSFIALVIVLVVALAALGAKLYYDRTPAYLSESIFAPGKPFLFPNSSSTQTELRAWNDLVRSHAVASKKIDMTDCKPSPKVVSAKAYSTVTLENKGDKPITFNLQRIKVAIQPRSTSDLYIDLGKGPGIYVYRCATSTLSIGAIVVN